MTSNYNSPRVTTELKEELKYNELRAFSVFQKQVDDIKPNTNKITKYQETLDFDRLLK